MKQRNKLPGAGLALFIAVVIGFVIKSGYQDSSDKDRQRQDFKTDLIVSGFSSNIEPIWSREAPTGPSRQALIAIVTIDDCKIKLIRIRGEQQVATTRAQHKIETYRPQEVIGPQGTIKIENYPGRATTPRDLKRFIGTDPAFKQCHI